MAVVLIALTLAALAVVLVRLGAHREAPWTALDDQPPTPLAGFARVVLGVYVRKNSDAEPEQITPLAKGQR